MSKRRVLTGITTTGTPHLGNYVGAIRPAIAASRDPGAESFFFLADYHALVKCDDPARIQRSTLEIAASWLACGLDPEKVYFYRQSDIPEIPELTWLLTCVTAKGLLNRAHAYKAATDANREKGDDPDAGVNAGLYMYPVLMAADILLFNANQVPVGRDQIQHIEMARDIGQRFNHLYSGGATWDSTKWNETSWDDPGRPFFVLPEAVIEDNVATLPGLDGRKMSKSYDNTIPLWLPAKELRKAILGIVTNSQAPGEPKNPDESHIFSIYQAFADPLSTAMMRSEFEKGIAWGEAKELLFGLINKELELKRDSYQTLMGNPSVIEDRLQDGAAKARAIAKDHLEKLRDAVGLRSLRHLKLLSAAADVGATVSAPLRVAKAPYFAQFKDESGKYSFKFFDGDGNILLLGILFDSPRDAGQAIATIKQQKPLMTDGSGTLAMIDGRVVANLKLSKPDVQAALDLLHALEISRRNAAASRK
jgi:tryptophanyl-tRNA synthetase